MPRRKRKFIAMFMAFMRSCLLRAMFAAEQSNELHQFHAAKAFTGYIDRLVEASYRKAEQRFEQL